MFALHNDLGWVAAVLWLLGVSVGGYAVAWVATDRLHIRRTPYIALLAAITGGLTAGYLLWSGAGSALWLDRWGWGVIGAVVAGGALAVAVNRARLTSEQVVPQRVGVAAVLWEAGVYGVVEGLLLSVLPVLITWQAFATAGWTDGIGAVVAGGAAMLASVVLIVVHHLGYVGYRGRRLVLPVVACGVLSLAFLLTGNPIAAMGGHALLHAGILRRGMEMPPHAAAAAPAASARPAPPPGRTAAAAH
jgi:hypothetical protein